MKVKAKASAALLLAALLTWLCFIPAAVAAADDNPAAVASAKRAAALKMSHELPSVRVTTSSLGVFISADGLALVSLFGFAQATEPVIVTADGTELRPGIILGIFPEQELALVKFKHRPKVWLPLSPKEPDAGEIIAISALCHQNSWQEKVPPVTGPVMAKRSSTAGNLREVQFKRVLSLGAGLSAKQQEALAPGSFAVNSRGQLVAVYVGINLVDRQKLILLAPVAGLAGQIEKMAQEPKAIPFPLPAARNPIDPAFLDPAYSRLMRTTDLAAIRTYLAELRLRHPGSSRLDAIEPGPEVTIAGRPVASLTDIPPLDAKASAAAQVERLQMRAVFLTDQKPDAAAALRELTAALALCPKDYPDIRLALGVHYLQQDQPAEAEPFLREALTLTPESIALIEIFEKMLTQQDKFDEAGKFTDRLYEMERLYRPKY